jgi:ABC-2 type transport system ATP-binding protein
MSIVAHNLSKSYRFSKPAQHPRAVDSVTFSVPAGSITGLAGPNGAGKSTLLKILAGLLPPDEGGFNLCGLDSSAEFARIRSEASLAEAKPGSFYMRLSAKENLDFFSALYGLSKKLRTERIEALAEILNISDSDRSERFDRLSAGTAQKFSLVRALMRDFKVLLLDEPAKGLDFKSALSLRGLVKRLALEGKTVMYASHDLRELAGISEKTLVLKNGKLAAEIPGSELKEAEALGRDAMEKLFDGIIQR